MGQNKDAAIGFGVIIAIIAIIVGVVLAVTGSGESKIDESKTGDKSSSIQEKKNGDYTDEEVKEFIMSYKGKDNSGDSLGLTLAQMISIAYPDEDIMQSPSTSGSFTPDLNYDGYWDVYFDLTTYRESVSFQWTVDMETKSVYAKNENGKNILDGLDAFD
jgi:hypothetical protein